jgi:hypothetical protein
MCAPHQRETEVRDQLLSLPEERVGDMRRHMFIPVLRRISAIAPTVLNPAWIDNPPPTHNSITVVRRYAAACELLHGAEHDQHDMENTLLSIYTQLTRPFYATIVEPNQRTLSVWLPRQLKCLEGADPIFSEVVTIIDRLDTSTEDDDDVLALHAHKLRIAGATERVPIIRDSILAFLDRIWPQNMRVRRDRRTIAAKLDQLIALTCAARLAVAMALHPRLGAASGLHCLDDSNVRGCVEMAEPEGLITWDGVL